MNIAEIKDLMNQFDASSLREFSYSNQSETLTFSKNEAATVSNQVAPLEQIANEVSAPLAQLTETAVEGETEAPAATTSLNAEGDVVESPLVGLAYLAPAPDKANFVSVGDRVSKGQTLLIIEAMKVMNEIPSPKDGVVTEILVENEEVVDFGKGLVRIK